MKRKFRKGVFIVCYYLEDGIPNYAVLKRKKHWTGLEFPKAGVERFETRRHAAKREVKEEIGLKPIKLKKHNFKGKYLYPKEFSDRKGIIGQTFSLYSSEVKKGNIKVDKSEHSSGKWMPYEKALKSVKFENQKQSLRIVNDWLKSRK